MTINYDLCPICNHTPAFCYHLEKADGGHVDLGISRAEKSKLEEEKQREHIFHRLKTQFLDSWK